MLGLSVVDWVLHQNPDPRFRIALLPLQLSARGCCDVDGSQMGQDELASGVVRVIAGPEVSSVGSA